MEELVPGVSPGQAVTSADTQDTQLHDAHTSVKVTQYPDEQTRSNETAPELKMKPTTPASTAAPLSARRRIARRLGIKRSVKSAQRKDLSKTKSSESSSESEHEQPLLQKRSCIKAWRYPGLQSSSSYRQLTTVGSCHQYTISGINLAAALGPGTRLCSEWFEAGGQQFRLEIYPAGISADTTEHLSIFLTTSITVNPNHVLYEIAVVDQSGRGRHLARSSRPQAQPAFIAHSGVLAGYPCFVRAALLEKHARRYLANDCLVVRATVEVVRSWSAAPQQVAIPGQLMTPPAAPVTAATLPSAHAGTYSLPGVNNSSSDSSLAAVPLAHHVCLTHTGHGGGHCGPYARHIALPAYAEVLPATAVAGAVAAPYPACLSQCRQMNRSHVLSHSSCCLCGFNSSAQGCCDKQLVSACAADIQHDEAAGANGSGGMACHTIQAGTDAAARGQGAGGADRGRQESGKPDTSVDASSAHALDGSEQCQARMHQQQAQNGASIAAPAESQDRCQQSMQHAHSGGAVCTCIHCLTAQLQQLQCALGLRAASPVLYQPHQSCCDQPRLPGLLGGSSVLHSNQCCVGSVHCDRSGRQGAADYRHGQPQSKLRPGQMLQLPVTACGTASAGYSHHQHRLNPSSDAAEHCQQCCDAHQQQRLRQYIAPLEVTYCCPTALGAVHTDVAGGWSNPNRTASGLAVPIVAHHPASVHYL